jgi:hypothetical protein
MYKAILTSKRELEDGRLEVTVSYSDGVDTHTETFIPQDKQGYFHRTKQVAESLTTAKILKTEDNVGKEIVVTPVVDTRTAAEKAQALWLETYYRLEQLEKLNEKSFLTGARLTLLNKKIADTKTFLDANIKVEYLDVI